MKKCKKCDSIKELSEFHKDKHKKDGVSTVCISCRKIYSKNINQAQKERVKIRAKKWYEKNKDLTIARAKEWKSENKDKVLQCDRNWRKKETSKVIRFMRDSLRRCMISKDGKRTESILGYSRIELLNHIEKQFSKGMSWENHGEWHIDHIIPITRFIEIGESNPSIINSLTNLKPTWAKDNLSKGSKMEFLL